MKESPAFQEPVVFAVSLAVANDDHGMGQFTARAVGDVQNTLTVKLVDEEI